MAIGLGRFKQAGQQMATSERLAKEYAKQQKKAKKRRGWKGILGKIAGTGLGAGLAGLLGVASGGLLMPLVMAAGQFGGKKLAHEATRGMGAKTTGLKGDEYGYGKGEAKTLAEGLRAQMATDPLKEKGAFGKDVLESYLSAGLQGKLGGTKDIMKGDFSKGLLGTEDWKWGGAKGAMAGIGDLFDVKKAVDPSSYSDEFFDAEKAMDSPTEVISPEGWSYQQGGQVPDQQQLMQLLALLQQQKAYDGTALEEVSYEQEEGQPSPTISEYFNMQGKSLGGSNKQSLAEMLGRK